MIHTYRQADAAGAFRTETKVPAGVDRQAAEVEARMQKVCEHYFDDDPELGPVVRRLSPGTGHLDRANDLLGYAEIYEAQADVMSKDPKHYRATDVADARRLAGEIMSALALVMTPRARASYELLQRAWTLLVALYFEVQTVGLCLLRYDPQRNERFPSLYAAGRAGRPRRRKDGGATGAAAACRRRGPLRRRRGGERRRLSALDAL
ncbi:hypothetical protein [Sorangium sp. So ce131]|uniref:hypothetical protein n=1 Tax=Sorangium sp. So ce131 TaxID=3133282 RepID=UPI003F5F1759